MNKKKILFEFTSFNLQTSYQLLQAAFDFLIQFLVIPEKSKIEILTMNKEYYQIAFGKLLINQIWNLFQWYFRDYMKIFLFIVTHHNVIF